MISEQVLQGVCVFVLHRCIKSLDMWLKKLCTKVSNSFSPGGTLCSNASSNICLIFQRNNSEKSITV